MHRTPTQNVKFDGVSAGDDEFEPPGHGIASVLREHLRQDCFGAAEEDNWRDCGWSIDVPVGEVAIQVAVAKTAESNRWIAQISVLNEPGLLSRFFGRAFVPRTSEVLAVARSIHKCLVDRGYHDILWCLDGFPEKGKGEGVPIDTSSVGGGK